MEANYTIETEKIRREFSPDWDIPEFRIEFWDGKKNNYSVVIPVINEGRRIRQFVSRLKQNNIDKVADIIIVDGGSTDGSLNPDFLSLNGVKGLLTKTGSGKLGSQLRIGYSFCLAFNYEGTITIDGNNKDDPTSIPSFIKLLQNGYDFIQASRYIEGGEANNTPIARNMAIRLLHAPLLSLFSGFHWTDTTQGYRGYSQRLLQNEKLSVFRSIFQNYELLAYLSAAAPRLGFKCIEFPTNRSYPYDNIPTKISWFYGNIELFITLLKACFGSYSVKRY